MSPRSFQIFGSQSNGNWRKDLEDLNAMRQELVNRGSVMSPYEFLTNTEYTKDFQEKIFPAVSAAVLKEHEAAIAKMQRAREAYKKEQSKEVDRWEPNKFNTEIDLAHKRVNLALSAEDPGPFIGNSPTKVQKLTQLMAEAKQSENIYTKRAIFEVVGALTLRDGPERQEVNHLAKEAQRELPKLRQTDGLKQAEQDERAALNEYATVSQQTIDTCIVLGQGNPTNPMVANQFRYAIERVQVDRDTGQVTILTPDEVMATHVIIVTHNDNIIAEG